MAESIWKDYEVSFGSVAETDYTIEAAGVAIFSGHAVRRPGQAQLTVRINDVCADSLLHALPSLSSAGAVTDPSTVTFTVKDGGGSTVDTVAFAPDWSYDYDHTDGAVSDPVNARVSEQQAIVLTKGSGNTAFTLRYEGGASETVTVSSSGGATQVVTLPLSSYTGLKSVTVAGITYDVVPACHRYALLYVNAYGGWDTLLCEGRSSEVDAYDRHTMRQRYDNAVRSARGTSEYVNEVARRWTLRTGWLKDDEAARMHHVLGSAHVWLYDIFEGALLPVIITDDNCEYKTYRGNGAQLVSYAVNVELAQEMTRR